MVCSLQLSAQSYNFTNYSLKDGLPQSQVMVIYQAKDRTLWLGTFGGVSNFDGKVFTSYSKADGLSSNSVNCILEDNQRQIYFGTEVGINVLKKGKISTIFSGKNVSHLLKDKQGTIWGITERKLFKIEKGKLAFYPLGGLYVNAINADQYGNLYAVVAEKGIYQLKNNKWVIYQELPAEISALSIRKILFDQKNRNKVYLLTYRSGIYVFENGITKPFFKNPAIDTYYALAQDNKGNMWVGSEKGAYLIHKNGSFIYFNAENGLSDNQVNEIFSDAENNVWISCFSDGIYKYEGDAFIRYNKFKGQNIAYPISGIAADKNDNLWFGTYNKGVFKYDGKKVVQIDNPVFKDKKIYFVYADRAKNIWISTYGNGVWKYDGQKFSQVLKPERFDNSCIGEDSEGGIWINGLKSSTYLKDGKIEKITGFEGYSSCIFPYPLSKDSVLLGTSNGVTLIRNKKIDRTFQIKALSHIHILSILKHGDNLIFATLGDGIITWNLKTKEIKRYVVANGLNSNDIYSLATDNGGNLWAGTGRGINKLTFNKQEQRYDVFRDHALIVECNQNAIINYKNNILVGTINGLIQCKIVPQSQNKKSPFIHIQQVSVFHKNDRSKDLSIDLNRRNDSFYKLNYSQNHISISFKGVYLTNPESVLYRYKLVGIDNDFSKPVPNTEIEYSAIRPGSYTFQVYAIANGQQSNIEQFSFTIVPPYYDTVLFKIIAFLVMIFLIWLIFYLIFKTRERKKYQFEKLKLKEQEKIRKQTAEDFHDDIGNKLTRINVLSELLDKKVDGAEKDQKELIRLIRENAGLLYTGTKDILWALDPHSDNLFEILVHIKNFGIDLFQNTGVDFKMEGVLPKYQKLHLSMEFNRNLTLIFKEMLNNVLKHAKATQVLIMVIETDHHTINILTTDDGQGFDLESVERGRGLNNIQTRCKRIKSTFQISSIKGKGTTTTISTRIPVTK
ncbi:two-component regulator propeller domain-containing protein [Pedobacter jeongneungensis]|uniref:ligand-binding sensor domain-containing protein n=1 Tax=Pedobacter jeongneungensis TaxID=947309 RepID=UPI000B2ED031|nr:sensor histidine kinase [Pedobacter jeongneungensis]